MLIDGQLLETVSVLQELQYYEVTTLTPFSFAMKSLFGHGRSFLCLRERTITDVFQSQFQAAKERTEQMSQDQGAANDWDHEPGGAGQTA